MQIEPSEVVPGLVVHLDPAVLAALGGSTTNATLTDTEDRAVRDEHEFLVLMVDAQDAVALAVPLFSDSRPGNDPLDDSKKSGPAAGWIGGQYSYHYSRWQHWWIPISSFPSASANDWTAPGDRHLYAADDPATLAAIAGWRLKNRNAFRGV